MNKKNKITYRDVLIIRHTYRYHSEDANARILAKRFGVCISNIYEILQFRIWKVNSSSRRKTCRDCGLDRIKGRSYCQAHFLADRRKRATSYREQTSSLRDPSGSLPALKKIPGDATGMKINSKQSQKKFLKSLDRHFGGEPQAYVQPFNPWEGTKK